MPETIITAIASPIARPTPSTTAAAIPLFAAGTDTLKYVSIGVAPSASDASSYSGGTASSAVSETLIIDGRIIIARTIIAAKRLAPSAILNVSLTHGTSTSIPTRPYTTDGIPASRLTAISTTAFIFLFATFARYTAVRNPIGTPIMMAPAVPYILVRINGRIPYDGVDAVDAHFFPNKNLNNPISLIAGIPAKTR